MKLVLYGSPVADRRDWLASKLGRGWEVVFIDYSASTGHKQAAFAGAHAVVSVRYDVALPAEAQLQLIQVPGVGCDEIDFDIIPRNATLCNVHGHHEGVAEFVILQLLEWRHRTGAAIDSFRRGSWEHSSRFGAKPHGELLGGTIGIVGYGGIGRALAKRLRPFGVRLLAANRSMIEKTSDIDEFFPLDRIDRMFSACDFAIVSIALNEQTRGLIGERELTALGEKGVLVNVARGPVVNETSLWTCLTNGRLGGAVLDVWYRYPDDSGDEVAPSRYPLIDLPNVVATPHISGWTTGTVERRWTEILENIRRIGTSKPFLNTVRAAEGSPR